MAATLRRLPTLVEVMNQGTQCPVRLHDFYAFLQRDMNEDALDFLLDVRLHENLCKAYVYLHADTSAQLYEQLFEGRRSEDEVDASVTLEEYGIALSNDIPDGEMDVDVDAKCTIQHDVPTSGLRLPSRMDAPVSAVTDSPACVSRPTSKLGTEDSSFATLDIADITLPKLVRSAKRIYARYMQPGAEHEVLVPPSLRERMPWPLPAGDGAQNAATLLSLYGVPKAYVFENLEDYAFPAFIQERAFTNQSAVQRLIRLSLGLLVLWVALTVGFSCVFLDARRHTRAWIVLPLAVAIYLLVSQVYSIDPLLAVLGYTETEPGQRVPVNEPYIRLIHLRQAFNVLLWTITLTAALACLFIFVPGHHL